MKLRDRFWQWGHTEGRYNHCYGIEEESRMTPMEGCLYFGVPNTFMVPVAEEVNKRQYNKSFKTLKEVVWECYAAGRNPAAVDEIIEDAREFTNITGIVFDDFEIEGVPKSKITQTYEVFGQDRSLLVFPLKWALTILPPTGSLTNFIKGGHAKVKLDDDITIFYYPNWN